mgnify:CR=1 FL=1|jgi:hypothetical protein
MADIKINLLCAFLGIMFWDICKLMFNWWCAKKKICTWEKDRVAALKIIRKQGFDAHFYLPTAGYNPTLSEALETLASQSFIVTDRQGKLVGELAVTRSHCDGG